MNKLIKLKKPIAKIVFNKKIAKRFHDTRYYESRAFDELNSQLRTEETKRLISPRRRKMEIFINKNKKLLYTKTQGVFYKLQGIYNKNKEAALNGSEPPINTKLLHLVSSIPVLVTAYKKIRGNKGAMTLAYTLSDEKFNRLDATQRSYLNKTYKLPDGINKTIFLETSRLIRIGKYPWGTSRRIFIEKPGKPGALRPLTIPPFMDRVVQAAILMVLESIYEPWFEKQNVSFGFRPNKGVHDAIFSISNNKNRGFDKAIEGDIKGAYDNVNKDTLISILSKRIKDRKFLNFIRNRLDYQYYDSVNKKYIEDKDGVPQGGIDSPYLWNIYMGEFDNFVLKHTKELCDELNLKNLGFSDKKKVRKPTTERLHIERVRMTIRWLIKVLNKYPNNFDIINKHFNVLAKQSVANFEVPGPYDRIGQRKVLQETKWSYYNKNKIDTDKYKYELIQYNNKLNHKYFSLPPAASSHKFLKFTYCRYADDWILITNIPLVILEKLKDSYGEFLKEKLAATLSEEKTLLTNMKKTPVHFLGFEIRSPRSFKISRYVNLIQQKLKTVKANTAGHEIIVLPDRQRLIDRLHMKGYCDKTGFPKEIPWLSRLEAFIIIERFNAVILGFANYYTEFVKNPDSSLSRWIYILRYSCLKTLAQKYKTKISGIFKKFPNRISKNAITRERTIKITVEQTINGETFNKSWKLLTCKEALIKARQIGRLKIVQDTFWRIENNLPVIYPNSPTFPTIKEQSFLERIAWVNLRTQASLDSPCVLCGSTIGVEMHHLKHVRKNKYNLIPQDRTYEQLMYLRNRKQIPVCKDCHYNVLHKGNYGGTKINKLVPHVLYGGRYITIETKINSKSPDVYKKTLEEKGWFKIDQLYDQE